MAMFKGLGFCLFVYAIIKAKKLLSLALGSLKFKLGRLFGKESKRKGYQQL
jgi:hypothetical protein